MHVYINIHVKIYRIFILCAFEVYLIIFVIPKNIFRKLVLSFFQ